MPTNNASASSLAIDALNPLSLQGVIRSPLEINGPRSLSSFAIATGGTFNDNGGSNFAIVSTSFRGTKKIDRKLQTLMDHLHHN